MNDYLDEYDDYQRSRADEHLLRGWAFHSEEATYWAWVERVARELFGEPTYDEVPDDVAQAEQRAEIYAEFGSSWVAGGGRAADVAAAWRQFGPGA